MARLNVYLPDDLAERVRRAELNVSAVAQAALAAELDRRGLDAWLDALPAPTGAVSHPAGLAALDDARTDFGGPGGAESSAGDVPSTAR